MKLVSRAVAPALLLLAAVAMFAKMDFSGQGETRTDKERTFTLIIDASRGPIIISATVESSTRGRILRHDWAEPDGSWKFTVHARPNEVITIHSSAWIEGESGWSRCQIKRGTTLVAKDRKPIDFPNSTLAEVTCTHTG